VKECHDGRDEFSIQERHWELTELPKGKKAIGCKGVYAKKQESLKDDIVCYKVRLVVKGYAQRKGIATTRYSHLL